uniref:Zinc finger protein 846 n=2 Tax=Ceratitis capitata TaxID=7213 RepID=W8BN56_CERCA
MSVQLNMDLPLTITPIIPALKDLSVSAIPSTNTDQFPPPPDLTFHCMCCPAFFVNPYILYQHMNSQHPQPLESKEEDKTASEDDDQDYSWVLEPVCEIVDMGGDDDDDSDSDSDSDDDTSSSSSQSSSDSSSTVSASNSPTINPKSNNCNSQDEEENTRMTTVSINTVPTAVYEEVVGDDSSSSLSSPTESDFPMIKLKTADPRESTSIILINSKAADVDNATQAPPVHMNNVPAVYKPGRGRRSAAQNAQLAALTSGEQKCFQCAHCDASFQNAGDLSKHVRCHITNKPFQCAICEKTFTHIGSLNTHIRIHSGEKPYKCELCPKAFTQSSSLMVHIRSHSIKKPHQCHLCDKGFINSSSLVLHLKSHDDAEIFNCPECDKSFKQEDLLEKHLQMHTQQLVYQCSICLEAFRTSSELVQHMKCHMGEKPFTCSICDRSFTQSGSLGIHMRIHTGERPFQCKFCDKAFTQASSLSVHMKIHTGEKSFPCHICGKSYSQQAYLNKHIQAHLTTEKNNTASNEINGMPSISTDTLPSQETLVCIVCGALHKSVSLLALHVTQKHSVLLNNSIGGASQMQIPSDNVSEEERRVQELQYMHQLQLMLRSANSGLLPQMAMDVDIKEGDVEANVNDEKYVSIKTNEEFENNRHMECLEIIKQEFDPDAFDDYGAEEEVETEE